MPEEPVSLQVQGISTVQAIAKGTVSVRTNLAFQHLLGAARFSRQAFKVELENSGKPFGEFFEELIHLVTASVTLSVACLEAFANELFADGAQRFPSFSQELLDAVWELAEQRPFMEKYDLALKLNGALPFKKGDSAYQNVDALVHLRNALMHFKPEWDDAQIKHKKLAGKLQYKFSQSPFLPDGEPLFPKACMSHSCAEWAVNSVKNFLTYFQNTIAMEEKINSSYPALETR